MPIGFFISEFNFMNYYNIYKIYYYYFYNNSLFQLYKLFCVLVNIYTEFYLKKKAVTTDKYAKLDSD